MNSKKIILFPLFIIGLIFFTAMRFNNGLKEKVVCFGDSITRGAMVNGHSWVYLLSKEHKNFDFINEGRNGRKTSDKIEIMQALKENPGADYFLIMLGVNDLKDGNDSLVNACVQNMDWMISKIRRADYKTKIIILSPSNINLKTMSALNKKKKYNMNTTVCLIKLERKYNELAKEESVGFISLLKTVSPQNYVDGLHPNEKGQQQIADAVWKLMKKDL